MMSIFDDPEFKEFYEQHKKDASITGTEILDDEAWITARSKAREKVKERKK